MAIYDSIPVMRAVLPYLCNCNGSWPCNCV